MKAQGISPRRHEVKLNHQMVHLIDKYESSRVSSVPEELSQRASSLLGPSDS